MILCPSCDARTILAEDSCPRCGFIIVKVDGFQAWSPELAKNNDGFPEESFKRLARAEAGSFWFRSRNALVLWALRKYFTGFQSLLEVGCGTGFVLRGIRQEFPDARIVGTEIYTAGLAFASRRLPSIALLQMDARKLPYVDEFDVLGAFDVIEHILEDELVLQNFYRAIKPGGGLPDHRAAAPVALESTRRCGLSSKAIQRHGTAQ
jgi:SAM-dependent methyltransferase